VQFCTEQFDFCRKIGLFVLLNMQYCWIMPEIVDGIEVTIETYWLGTRDQFIKASLICFDSFVVSVLPLEQTASRPLPSIQSQLCSSSLLSKLSSISSEFFCVEDYFGPSYAKLTLLN
jgi:hypothetical protein